MKSASFSSDIDKFVVAAIDDYARLCDTVFADIPDKSTYKILSKQNMNTLVDDIILKSKTNSKKIINIKNNNDFIIIDIPKKITIVFAQ